MASEEDLRKALSMPDDTPQLNYEVTIFDEQLGWSVLNKVRVTRHGAAALIHEFTELMWTDVSRVMAGLDDMKAPVFRHESHIDDNKPYNVEVTTHFLRPQSQPMVDVEPYGQVPENFPKITRAMMESQPSFMDNVALPRIPKGWL